jgi:hypothetical protein
MSSPTEIDDMEPEYDFSSGERGKFYRPNAVLHIPIYLDADVDEFINEIAKKTGRDAEQLVNEWLRNSIDIIQSAQPEPGS